MGMKQRLQQSSADMSRRYSTGAPFLEAGGASVYILR